MEGLAAAGGVVAVVSLAGQVVQGCGYLRRVFGDANSAPKELGDLTVELAIIEDIVHVTPDDEEHKDALDFCNEAVGKLRKIVDKYGALDRAGRNRKWCMRLSMALNVEKIGKHLNRLREAKGYLEHLQNM